MELILISTGKYGKKKVEQDHYWYDHVTKQMLHGRGGRMEFQYSPQERRWLPHLVDEYKTVYGNNFNEAKAWVQKFAEVFNLSDVEYSGDRNIRLTISPLYLNDALDSLKRYGIVSEYEPAEYRKEMDQITKDQEKNTWCNSKSKSQTTQ